jgi:hypothetical protein
MNHLSIPSDSPPLLVSRKHLSIELSDGTVWVVDRGSRFGTWVGPTAIGRGKGAYRAPLAKGETLLRLAGKHSPYTLAVTCR